MAAAARGILGHIEAQALARPTSLMLVVDGEALERRVFVDEVTRLAAALEALGVGQGDTVVLVLPNSVRWYALYWAAVAVGAIPVPLDPQAGEWELRQLLGLVRPTACFCIARFRANPIARSLQALAPELPELRAIVVCDGDGELHEQVRSWDAFCAGAGARPAAGKIGAVSSADAPREPLMYACTSGTTGASRVIVVPHAGFLRSQLDMAHYLGLGDDDRMLLGMPLYHQGGLGMGLQAILGGGGAAYLSRFEPESFLRAAVELEVTALQLSPTLAKILLSTPEIERFDLSRVRLCYFAGEVLPDEVARAFWQRRGIRVVNVIGSSETATMVVWDSDCDSEHEPSAFRPLPFTAVRVVGDDGRELAADETGDIVVRTDAVATSYLGNSAESARHIRVEGGQRWFATGDLGTRCADGRVRFVGRAKRIIKRGANLVYPEEIEAFLLTHPDIAAVAVLKEAHELFGEAIVAHVQPAPGVSLTRGDLVRFCRGQLSAYKIPDTVIVSTEIPTGIGKVQYKYVRK